MAILASYSDAYSAGTNGLLYYNTDYRQMAQGFKVTSSGKLLTIVVPLKKTGLPTGTMTMTVEDDSAGNPSSVLATAGTSSEASLTTSYTDITFTFTGVNQITLSYGVQYHIQIDSDRGVDGSNYVSWQHDENGSYANGVLQRKDATTWYTAGGGVDADFIVNGTIISRDAAFLFNML